ncbi:hypothetical protein [Xanthomonas phage Suba]|uniref:Uncharacterized protein n=1 Tax=Xanthomonas phage Suba TaxID=2674975 RepID=A0A679KD85_9CAUD|nr:hypothetical protein QAY88_gp54 [Xanthomonas phage Suba]CAA2409887.1 hypothetical protein [Xanthomonas phage Suba]
MHRMVFIDEGFAYDDIERMSRLSEKLKAEGFHVINAIHPEDNEMHNSRTRLMITAGLAALGNLFIDAAANPMPSFAGRYGNNPKSLNGSYRQNSNAAKQKRAAVKRRNIAKHGR